MSLKKRDLSVKSVEFVLTVYLYGVYLFGMGWVVEFTNRSRKQKEKLPRRVQTVLFQLVKEIETSGPVRGSWPNYSKLSTGVHHCHLKKGKPTYVAVWQEAEGKIRVVEVIYAGSHEKAPYQ